MAVYMGLSYYDILKELERYENENLREERIVYEKKLRINIHEKVFEYVTGDNAQN